MPPGEDHWHFLSTIGLVILVDHEPLRKGLLAGDALALLAQWSRRLPTEGRTLDELERVGVRLALEWIDAARLHAGGFPWRLPNLEVARRLRQVEAWSETLVRAGAIRRAGIPEVAELRTKVRTLLARESVRLPFGRLSAESECWEELRRAMRVERGRRSREDLAPLAAADVAVVRREIEEVGRRFAERGEWAEAIWAEPGMVVCPCEAIHPLPADETKARGGKLPRACEGGASTVWCETHASAVWGKETGRSVYGRSEKAVGEPDAGNPPVRFDEGAVETGASAKGMHGAPPLYSTPVLNSPVESPRA